MKYMNTNNIRENQILIEDITCQACVSKIEKKLSKTDGVENIVVNISNKRAKISYDEKKIKLSEIFKIIEKLGYNPSKIKNLEEEEKEKQKKAKIEIRKIEIVIALSLLEMYVAMGTMIGLPLPRFFSPENNVLNFVFLQLLLTLAVMFIANRFYTQGFKHLILKNPNMDTLVAMGTMSAFLYSIYISLKIFFGEHHLYHSLYYESATTIIAFIMLGKYFENLSIGKTSETIKKLKNIQEKKANIIRGEEIIQIDIEEITKEDVVFIRAGERIPVDGEIIEGIASIDEAMLTGESIAVLKEKGDKVYSGTINKDGVLKVKVEKLNEETFLSKIAELVENAQMTKAPIAKLADKISLYFVPFVIGLAVITTFIWYIIIKFNFVSVGENHLEFILKIFISILVIACPCSLGLATPLSIIIAIGRGAGLGILIKNGEALQKLSDIDVVVFDKTGTLTEGKPKIVEIENISELSSNEILKLAYSLEINSEHPLASSINKYIEEKQIGKYPVERYLNLTGLGTEGIINNKKYSIGNMKLMNRNFISVDCEDKIKKYEKDGNTTVLLADDKKVLAIFALMDTERKESKYLVEKLKKLKIDSYMLTGDNENTAKKIAENLGIKNVFAALNPEDKYEKIKKLQIENKKVAVVGDGINDSPALAKADIGIAIGAGADIAIESADVILISKTIDSLIEAINLSKITMKCIKQNLFWAFLYNIMCIPIAAGVLYVSKNYLLSPMIAALAMSFSSICVVFNSSRLKFIKIEK